ncbi:MAG: ABC transporter permease subunit [Coriobacteriia bacterium]
MDAFMNGPVVEMLRDPVLYIGLGNGLLLTLEIAAISIVLSSVFGTIIGAMRYSGFPVISHIATTYIEVVRNLPQILLILVRYSASRASGPRSSASPYTPPRSSPRSSAAASTRFPRGSGRRRDRRDSRS